MKNSFNHPVVILANGAFPTHAIPLSIIDNACTLICTDGSADIILRSGNQPHVIIGDQDSTQFTPDSFQGLWIPVQNQDKTDLHKALDWCNLNHIDALTIVGATGKREDHSLANINLIQPFSAKINLSIVTDFFTITCHKGAQSFSSFKGQIVSLFGSGTISTYNLTFELSDKTIQNESHGVSNESLGKSFKVKSSEPVLVFRSHPE